MSSGTQASVSILGGKSPRPDGGGDVFSLATVLLAIRRTIWTWPAGALLLLVAPVSAHAPGHVLKLTQYRRQWRRTEVKAVVV